MPVAALDGQGNADGDAPGEADSDGVGYLSYDESASDTEQPAANHRDENDPLGQAPMNVALLPSRGKYDQRAAKRKPMQPAKSHHQASRRLRNLLPAILKTSLTFAVKNGVKPLLGLQWQCFCLVHKHGHPLTEQREHGGVSLEDGACGDDSDCIVALTPPRFGNVAAGFEVVDDLRLLLDGNESAMHSCVDVNALLEDLGDYEAWERSITARAGVAMSIRDKQSAMFFFRRCLRLAIGGNGDITGPSQPPWGTSVLLALRKATNGQQTRLLVFLWDGRRGAAANRRESLGDRLRAARSLWLTDPLLPGMQPESYCPLVTIVRTQQAVNKVCQAMRSEDLMHRKPVTDCDSVALLFMRGQTFEERAANGGESLTASSQEQADSQEHVDESVGDASAGSQSLSQTEFSCCSSQQSSAPSQDLDALSVQSPPRAVARSEPGVARTGAVDAAVACLYQQPHVNADVAGKGKNNDDDDDGDIEDGDAPLVGSARVPERGCATAADAVAVCDELGHLSVNDTFVNGDSDMVDEAGRAEDGLDSSSMILDGVDSGDDTNVPDEALFTAQIWQQ